ncbi:hypothetical protein NPIL_189701 [Nephila pilipes]|uniref:Uncharacterized protein n=1 Tax=Nephila pilipes TaxID=299642 RepID=A0A8X6U3T3_NEPPI|nr:hypothetical protein NPIL_189701 [Nephila pilipes]
MPSSKRKHIRLRKKSSSSWKPLKNTKAYYPHPRLKLLGTTPSFRQMRKENLFPTGIGTPQTVGDQIYSDAKRAKTKTADKKGTSRNGYQSWMHFHKWVISDLKCMDSWQRPSGLLSWKQVQFDTI